MKKSAQEIYDKLRGCCDECKLPNEEDVLDAMEEYADQFKPKWISVEDELPKPNESVLIFSGSWVKFGYKQDQKYYKRQIPIDKFTSSMREVRNVTHWMPLPENPTT